jgi:O-antigen ligase
MAGSTLKKPTRGRKMGVGAMSPLMFLFLSPLIYSIDGDPYRAYEVVFVSLIIFLMFIRSSIFKTTFLDILAMVLFSALLIIQQFFLDNGNPFLGIKFFITTIAAFVPFWLIRSVHWRYHNVERIFERSIKFLFWLASISILLSFFTGMGERYTGGIAGYRAFGYMGDSFSAVMVFLLLFYALEGSKFHTAMCIIVIVMMGGKAAILMLIFCFIIYWLFVKKSIVYKFFGLASIMLVPMLIGLIMNALPLIELSIANRIISYELGVQYFLESPIYGIGINQGLERVGYDSVDLAKVKGIDSYFEVHQVQNAYLRTLSETGLIGFSLMMLVVYFWTVSALKSIRFARLLPKSSERSMIYAGGIWVIGFVAVYQSTGWFLAGHPQLSWLLMFSTLSIILADRKRVDRKSVIQRDF